MYANIIKSLCNCLLYILYTLVLTVLYITNKEIWGAILGELAYTYFPSNNPYPIEQ